MRRTIDQQLADDFQHGYANIPLSDKTLKELAFNMLNSTELDASYHLQMMEAEVRRMESLPQIRGSDLRTEEMAALTLFKGIVRGYRMLGH